MSNLKKTHLSAFGGDAYSLFEKYVKTEEVHFLSELFRSKGFEMVSRVEVDLKLELIS